MSMKVIATLTLACLPLAFAEAAPRVDSTFGQTSPDTGAMASSISKGLGSDGALQKAQEPITGRTLPAFKQADTNHDGKIEWKEARADKVPRAIFKKEDYESSGTLDRSEWTLADFAITEARARKKKSNS